ncbi:MAG: leucine--tRNA ligase [Holosporales bacterium]|jgi:leucyl-tRNA synthetase|nr:leucine--tRNA ligase [Holosporales bacterium]
MYNFKKVESEWHKIWQLAKTNKTLNPKNDEKKLYILEMFPYPSGKLHMGHIRNYTIGDVLARFKKAKGYKILHPMGWDSFGMPAENAAIKHGIHPKTWTNNNVQAMREALQTMGFTYDWDYEVATHSEEYYSLEQQIFLDLYENKLVYRKDAYVNWDPVENTVLANEQVIDGCGWRSGVPIVKKKIPHWCIKITKYAEELLKNLEDLKGKDEVPGWPEKVLTMQEMWIGKSSGLEISFDFQEKIEDFAENGITVFTTRPETLFGASFCAIAPEHKFSTFLAQKNQKISDFIKKCQEIPSTECAISTTEKIGFDTGIFVKNPFNKEQSIKVYIANFVLMEYGVGAVFGCPAHDERDFEFATRYNLSIKSVIKPESNSSQVDVLPYIETVGIMINSSFLDGLSVLEAREKAIQTAEQQNLGVRKTIYRLRDWTVSRQRYWGCPIPMIHCKNCGIVPVPKKDLPVLLPEDVTFDQPGNPLDRHEKWKHVTCPKCGKPAQRETDTLDTFFESSWYFLRFCNPHSVKPIDKLAAQRWMPVDLYIGGIEHAVLHLLYARFFSMALRDMGYTEHIEYSKVNDREPFRSLLTQGMVCHTSFQDSKGNWLFPDDVEKLPDGSYILSKTKEKVTAVRAEKMSKSKNNVVDPETTIEAYGVDSLRLFIMSDSPYDKDFQWSTESLDGTWRYLNKMWRFCENIQEKMNFSEKDLIILPKKEIGEKEAELLKIAHTYLSKITNALNQFSFHTAIAFHRELTKALENYDFSQVIKDAAAEAIYIWLVTIFPFTPHFALEAFEILFKPKEIHIDFLWPEIREDIIQKESTTIAVQVCGKLRGTFSAPIGADDAFLHEQSLALPAVQKFINGKQIKKVIIIKDKLVNVIAD